MDAGLGYAFPFNGTGKTSAPDILVIHSGNWDLQDHETNSLLPQISQLLAILRRWLPKTQLLWIGPLQLVTPGAHWRTGFRAEQHSSLIANALGPHNIPLINAHSVRWASTEVARVHALAHDPPPASSCPAPECTDGVACSPERVNCLVLNTQNKSQNSRSDVQRR